MQAGRRVVDNLPSPNNQQSTIHASKAPRCKMPPPSSSASASLLSALFRLRTCHPSLHRPAFALAARTTWLNHHHQTSLDQTHLCQTHLYHARFSHSISIPRPPTPPATSRSVQPSNEPAVEGVTSESPRPELPNPGYYQLSFTCVPCGHRSHHNVSKQAYHSGSSLITCPGCRNRHVISDHLGIFGNRDITVDQLMREKGRLVKRGSLGPDGDIEFWPDQDDGSDTSTKP